MKYLILLVALWFALISMTVAQNYNMNGKWKMMSKKSSFLDYYKEMTLDINVGKNTVAITTQMGPKRKYEEKLTFTTDRKINIAEIKDGTFSTNIHMGLRLPLGSNKEIVSYWQNDSTLKVVESYDYFASQGKKHGIMNYYYQLSNDNSLLTLSVSRSTRKKDSILNFVFKRFDENNAYFYTMADDWDINNKLPEQACWISLQGVVNKNVAKLYFTFAKGYPFNYTEDLALYLDSARNFTFTKLSKLEEAIILFKDQIKGYIIWDKKVRTSLIVSYTLAGLEDGIVITEDLLPLVKQYGLKEIMDFREKFSGMSDYEIYLWAKNQYWTKCSRDVIVWLGGVAGNSLMPACADYGMMKKAFFSDLSARPTDTLEYNLTKSLFADMKPLSQVWGWHSYKKDLEEQMTTLLSSYALTSDGLNTHPNTSFLIHIPVSNGFQFRNNHNIISNKEYIPDSKIYISFIQSDGIGIGAWFEPGRGTMPYAWEVTMKMYEMSPVLLEYYYKQATPNDYFIGSLSGSSYMYPKVFPKKWLPDELKRANNLMKNLDLKVFEIMDYSEGGSETCDNNLPEDLVDEYYNSMPDAIGFVNGYRASNTFTIRQHRPFMSYDYYLAAEKPENEVVGDLEELAAINTERPYFLLVHVRESSDIARVKSICDKLSGDINVVPLDIFLKLAGNKPTFKEYFYKVK